MNFSRLEKYMRPVNPVPEVVSDYLESQGVTGDLTAIADRLRMPLGLAFMPDTRGQASVLRRALWVHLRDNLGWTYDRIGSVFDLDHSSVVKGIVKGRQELYSPGVPLTNNVTAPKPKRKSPTKRKGAK